jgi:hypothetical protein
MAAPVLLSWDNPPPRDVAVALELLDPVTGLVVSHGVAPKLADRSSKPIVSASGRFVWIGDAEQWPPSVDVEIRRAPYLPIVDHDLTAKRPPTWPVVKPHERLIQLTLTPTPDYQFSDGVTALQGWLFENDPPVPIADAEVWFEWAARGTGAWQPMAADLRRRTDAAGRFSLFTRIPKTPLTRPDVVGGLVKIRVGVKRDMLTKFSDDSFQFLPSPAAAGRIPDGVPLPDCVALDWGVLV